MNSFIIDVIKCILVCNLSADTIDLFLIYMLAFISAFSKFEEIAQFSSSQKPLYIKNTLFS